MSDEVANACVSACSSLGNLGAVVFTVGAFAWGAFQARAKRDALVTAQQARAEKDVAIRSLELHLSSAPPAMLPQRVPIEFVNVGMPLRASLATEDAHPLDERAERVD